VTTVRAGHHGRISDSAENYKLQFLRTPFRGCRYQSSLEFDMAGPKKELKTDKMLADIVDFYPNATPAQQLAGCKILLEK
jgi:hypothetical protein